MSSLIRINAKGQLLGTGFFVAAVWFLVRFLPEVRSYTILVGVLSLFITRPDQKDKSLVFIIGYVGFAPIFSWIEHLGDAVDPVVILSALSSSQVLYSKREARKFSSASLLALPAALGSYLWWSSEYVGNANTKIKEFLLGWDHFGHFDLFASARENGVFKKVLEKSDDVGNLFNDKYPAGIHSAWANFWRPPDSTSRLALLGEYRLALIISFACCVFLLMQLVLRTRREEKSLLLYFTASSALVVPLVVFGHMTISLWSGFPNYLVVVVALVALISISRKPIANAVSHKVVLFGSVLVISYNWYPLILPVLGLLIPQFSRNVNGKSRIEIVKECVLWTVVGLFSLAAVIPTLSLGAEHLTLDGGISVPSPNLLFATVVGAACLQVSVYIFRDRKYKWYQLLQSPAVLGLVVALIVTLSIRVESGGYPYYQNKIVFAICTVSVFDVFINVMAGVSKQFSTFEEKSRKHTLVVTLGIFVFSFTQFFGYIGPDWATYAPSASAPGLTIKTVFDTQIERFWRPADLLVAITNEFENASYDVRECLVLADLDNQSYDPVLTNYWIGSLLRSLTDEHIMRSQRLTAWQTGTTNPHENAWAIHNTLDIKEDCPVVSRKVGYFLQEIDGRWKKRIVIINSNSSLTIPKSFNP